MGAAKRRGTLEQRIAQSVERQKIEDAARRERFLREEEARRARLAALPPQERKEAVLTASTGAHRANMLLAAMLGLGAGLAVRPSERVLVLDDAHHDISRGDSK